MTYTPIHIAKKTGKTMQLLDKKRFYEVLETLKDGLIEVVIRERKDLRSKRQNDYYWGAYLEIISTDSGSDKKELHQRFTSEFLVSGEKMVFGKPVNIIKSTTDLTKQEFSDYIKKIEALTGVPAPSTKEYNL